jgi:hypothetical protein
MKDSQKRAERTRIFHNKNNIKKLKMIGNNVYDILSSRRETAFGCNHKIRLSDRWAMIENRTTHQNAINNTTFFILTPH